MDEEYQADSGKIIESMEEKENRFEMMKKLLTPDLADKIGLGVTDANGNEVFISLLSKELKGSNINRKDLPEIEELSDLIIQWSKIGAIDFALFLLYMRDTKLSITSSIDGFQTLAANREVHEHYVKEEQKRGITDRIFRRGN